VVRELAERIKLGVPGGRKLDASEAIVLAQVAAAHGLDPFTGEVWYIPGSGPAIGIKGLRKVAAQAAARDGGAYWTEFRQIVDPKELARLAMPENALAFECRVFDTASIRGYAASIEAMTRAGCTFEQAQQMIGQRPATVGMGYWTPGEATKMKPAQAAMKRAEADALKRRYHIPFAFGDDTHPEGAGDAPAGPAGIDTAAIEDLDSVPAVVKPGGEPPANAGPARPHRTMSQIRGDVDGSIV
jgi:hypothetical protein